MWSRKAYTLSTLQAVMNYPRGNGKTWTMINGVANNQNGAVVIVPTQEYVHWMKGEIRNPKVKFVSLENLEQLRGNRLPVIVDHTTVAHVLTYVFEMLNELQAENNVLKHEIWTLKHGNEDEQSKRHPKNKKISR